MKNKETLGEVAERYNSQFLNQEENKFSKEDFINGAKWQQERMYEIMDAYADDVMGGCTLRAKEWFEQFKKK